MSTRPSASTDPASRAPVTLPQLARMKERGEPIVMVTAYDFPSARVAEQAGVDIVLVGDSGAMTVLGHNSTVPVDTDEMLVLVRAVRRGLGVPVLVGDLPFGSYEVSDEQAVATAVRYVKEGGCDAVKLEGGGPTPVSRARAIVAAGIPVMGHVGLTPQTATALGGYRSQGRTVAAAIRVMGEAQALQDAGCFALVFEAVPTAVAGEIMRQVDVPVIGIGAGDVTDGQVLVFHDLLGISEGKGARFVKQYANLHDAMVDGVRAYTEDVRAGRYPQAEHGYPVERSVVAELRRVREHCGAKTPSK